MVDAPQEAQLHVKLAGLAEKKIAKFVRGLGYIRARDTSLTGSRLMNAIARELGVPAEECPNFAAELLGGELVCPLGGTYELVATPDGRAFWTSSAVVTTNRFLLTEIPQNYVLPLLTWLRGAAGHVAVSDEAATAHFEVQVDSWQRRQQRQADGAAADDREATSNSL